MGKSYPKNAIYNKLVRDKIPEIIEADGLEVEIIRLAPKETVKHLKQKAVEESNELVEAEEIEEIKKEMSDILEILKSLAEELKVDINEIERIRQERAKKRGRFKNRTFLIRTKDKKK